MRIVFALVLTLVSVVTLADGCDRNDFRLAIDIGHTPNKPGAISARGRAEYEFNKVLAQELLDALGQDGYASAFIINPEGREIALRDRTAIAAARQADLFLSVHHDSVQPHYLYTWTVDGSRLRYSDKFRGYSLFVSAKQSRMSESLGFAKRLGGALREQGLTPTLHHAEEIDGENRPLLDADKGIYRFDDLIVLKTATMPAVLFEAGVIVHRQEEELLRSPEYRRNLINATRIALDQYCATEGAEIVR